MFSNDYSYNVSDSVRKEMEINRPDESTCVKLENNQSESSETEVLSDANNFCAIDIREGESRLIHIQELENADEDDLETLSLSLNSLDQSVEHIAEPLNLGALHPDIINEEIERRMSQATEVFIDSDERIQSIPYGVPDFLDNLATLNVKKESTRRWLCLSEDDSCDDSLDLETQDNGENDTTTKRKGRTRDKISTRRLRRKGKPRQDYRERLRRKAECMREKRRKLYEQETEEEKLERLAKEAAKRREMRMYYETPEQRRKRLDAEAARKREYRMYNETPEERRKRLDREAERRRIKRLTMYANETAEQRRERLNRESAKRREARLNQYSKETEDQRRERLRKDALRAREMRFTRSAIETEEERRQRLVKDALRKRELRTHCGNSNVTTIPTNFTELQNVRSFEELNNVQMRDDPDNQLGSHYLSNWMMWFQNTLTHPVQIGEQTVEPQSQNNG